MKTKEEFIKLRGQIAEALTGKLSDKYVIRKGANTVKRQGKAIKLVPELYLPEAFNLIEAHEINNFYNLEAEIIKLSELHRVNLDAIDAVIENYELFFKN